jgi:hypothetical protein
MKQNIIAVLFCMVSPLGVVWRKLLCLQMALNPANGIDNGPYAGSQGNAFPMVGTGKVIYTQVGNLLKKDLLGSAGTHAIRISDECGV